MSLPSDLTRHYDIHGVRLEVTAPDAAFQSALDSRLRGFAQAPTSADVHWRVAAGDKLPERPRGAARTVYDPPAGEVVYFDATDELLLDFKGRVRVRAALASGVVHTVFHGGDPEARVLASHPLFTIPLLELCKRRGRYPLHASCVASAGRGIVLPGGSGAGKTTLAVALLRAGYTFLSDDMVFVSAGGTRIMSFPDEIDVSDETARMVTELSWLEGRPTPSGRLKHSLRVEDAFTNPIDSECSAVALVFPEIAPREESRLLPLTRDDALLELAPNVLLTEPTSSQQHFDALAALVRSVPCFRLETGRDLEQATACLRPLVG